VAARFVAKSFEGAGTVDEDILHSVQGSSCKITLSGEELELLPEAAVYWPSQNALLVADLHIGKGAAFRADAMPIPSGSSQETLAYLSAVLRKTQSSKLFLLGDFWHAKQGRTDLIHEAVFDWRRRHADVEIVLIEGNHDRKSGNLPEDLGIPTLQDVAIDGFILKHHPEDDPRGYVLAGHIHPAVRLIGQGRQVEKLPAFVFKERVGILPAFGAFTGDMTVYPSSGDRVFVIAENHVVEVGLTTAAAR